MKNFLNKFKYLLIGIGLALSGTVYAINVTVPQSSQKGNIPIGNANGTYNSGFLVAGSNITISTSTTGQISISSTGGISGGINGYVARWTSASALSTGLLIDNGTVAGVNATSSTVSFNVQGSGVLNPFNISSSTGNSLLHVTVAGKVGIGTTTPIYPLHVIGNAQVDQLIINNIGGGDFDIFFGGTPEANNYQYRIDGSSNFSIYDRGNNKNLFIYNPSTGVSSVVGVPWILYDTLSVDKTLEIVGTSTFDSIVQVNTSTPNSAQVFIQGTANKNLITIASSTGTTLFQIFPNGSTTIASLNAASCDVKSTANGSLYCGTDATGASSGNSAWTIGNGLIYNATSTDLVGIGTITPTTTLFVQGKGGVNPFQVSSSTGTSLMKVDQVGLTTITNLKISALIDTGTDCLLYPPGGPVGIAGGNCIIGTGTIGQVGYFTDAQTLTSGAALLTNGTVSGVNATSSTVNFLVQGTGANSPFQVNSSTGTSLMVIRPDGNIGIGTGSPQKLLHIWGNQAVGVMRVTRDIGNNPPTAVYGTYDINLNTSSSSLTTMPDLTGTALTFSYNTSTNITSPILQGAVEGVRDGNDLTGAIWLVPYSNATAFTAMRISGNPNSTTTLIQSTSSQPTILAVASSSGTTFLQVTASAQILACTTCRLTIPQGTAPTLSAAGDIGVDTSNGGMFSFYANGRENLVATTTKAIFLQTPTASESYLTSPNYSFPVPVTITGVRCKITSQVSNTPSFTFSLPHDTTNTGSANAMTAGQACTATTTPMNITIGGDLTLAANETIWATSSAVSNASSTTIWIDFKYDN